MNDERAACRFLSAIPALPVKQVALAAEFYTSQLGFRLVHEQAGFAVIVRDDVELHLWAASDELWRERESSIPVVSGAESFIAGTASCRIGVSGVEALHSLVQPLGILHPNAPLTDQWWGTREFGVLDPDGNLVTFFERKNPRA